MVVFLLQTSNVLGFKEIVHNCAPYLKSCRGETQNSDAQTLALSNTQDKVEKLSGRPAVNHAPSSPSCFL